MIRLECGRDLVDLRIRTYEGWNITAFLDHVLKCDQCKSSEGKLIGELNKIIGGEESTNI
jgi:hypothetical protein